MSVVAFTPLAPWTPQTRAAVREVANDMAAHDADEIFGIRPPWHDAGDVVADVAAVITERLLLDGFIAWHVQGADEAVPVAVALAYRGTLPRVAEVVLFGRAGHARAVPEVYREIASRMVNFGSEHRIAIAQVPILTGHRAAMRMARMLGGEAAFEYGPIGNAGQSYTHTLWRLR